MKSLEDKSQAAASKIEPFIDRHIRDGLACPDNLALGGLLKTSHEVEQARLAAAGLPADGNLDRRPQAAINTSEEPTLARQLKSYSRQLKHLDEPNASATENWHYQSTVTSIRPIKDPTSTQAVPAKGTEGRSLVACPPLQQLLLRGLLLGFVTASAAVYGAGDCKHREPLPIVAGSLRVENDLFLDTDRDYTSGVALSLTSLSIDGPLDIDCLPLWAGSFARGIRAIDKQFWTDQSRERIRQNIVLRLGQAMYTPRDGAAQDLLRADRPYAGLLMMGIAWNRRWVDSNNGLQVLDTRELGLGMIGPASLAEQSQNWIHDRIGSERLRGWRNQLGNEPAVLISAERKEKSSVTPSQPFGWDWITGRGLRLGNVESSLVGSIEGRFGWHLPDDFGSYPIRPGADNRPPSRQGDSPLKNRGIYGFALLEAKALAWDFSLDGNMLRDSHRVERKPLQAQVALGMSGHGVLIDQPFKLTLMRVWRSKEFSGQVGEHGFVSLMVSTEW